MLQCVAVCEGVLQCVKVCCSEDIGDAGIDEGVLCG